MFGIRFGRGRAVAVGLALVTFALGSSPTDSPLAVAAPPPGVPAAAGPDLLRMPVATAPQLTNSGIWKEPSILVSGAMAYRRGEFMYQDYLYDDHGANGSVADPTYAKPLPLPVGTYTYPSSVGYYNNAADLVEFRVKRVDSKSTSFRVTLNSLTDPSLVAFTIALGGETLAPRPYPFGANVSGPAAKFVTVHGLTAVVTDAQTGLPISPAPTVSVDLVRRQFTVTVAKAAWDPGNGVALMAIGVGLWDNANGTYLLPGTARDTARPGGSGALLAPPAFFNVGFRFNEPVAGTNNDWRDAGQAATLASGTMTPYTVLVDFKKLGRKLTDESGVPKTGPINRILQSHFEFGQGVDPSRACNLAAVKDCSGQWVGNLQPYALYVPPQQGNTRYGLTLLLHSLNYNYNQYLGTKNQRQFAERDTGVIVMTTQSRGPDGMYTSAALADVFEVWADVARNYPLEPEWTTIAGYSMGGFGTYFIAEAYPDLFARGQSTVGSSYSRNSRLASLRNVPILAWNAAADELVPLPAVETDAATLQLLGYRYEQDVFTTAEHLTLSVNDEYQPAADFLGTARVEANPFHVTYVVNPYDAYPQFGMAADRAYWLSGMKVRVVAPEGLANNSINNGVVDAFSYGFGKTDPAASGQQAGSGVLTGGVIPVLPYTRQYQTWGEPGSAPVANRLDLDLKNVAEVTIDVARARVSCDVDLRVTTDGPARVTLAGCGRTVDFG